MNGIDEYQVIDNSVFHEYTVVDKKLVKVSPWFPPETKPWSPGRYQGLVRLPKGEKVIRDFVWDGLSWKRLESGRFTQTPFEWRGLAESN